MAGEDPLDPEALDRLRALQGAGEPDIVADLASLFLEDAPRRLAALASGEPELVRRAAHSLRGSASLIGATALTRACAVAEDAPTAEAVGRILVEFDALRPAIDALRGGR